MTDIVLNTNALTLLLDEEFIERILAKSDHVFVTKCVWRKELKGIYTRALHLFYTAMKKLGKRFHLSLTNIRNNILPNNLKRSLMECGADDCDLEIARLTYDRRRKSGQRVHLISKDSCFHNSRPLLEHDEINIKNLEEFKSSY